MIGAIVAGAIVLRREPPPTAMLGAAVIAGGCMILGLATALVAAMVAIDLVRPGRSCGGHGDPRSCSG